MEIRIKCDPEFLDQACAIMQIEAHKFDKYNKIGSGWEHGNYKIFRMFVRKTKNGLSGVQTYPKKEG